MRLRAMSGSAADPEGVQMDASFMAGEFKVSPSAQP
jgi:hypothetical protein